MASHPRYPFAEWFQSVRDVLLSVIQEIPVLGIRLVLYGIMFILSLFVFRTSGESRPGPDVSAPVCPSPCHWTGFDTTVVDPVGPLTLRFRILTDEYRWRYNKTVVELAEGEEEEDLESLLDGMFSYDQLDGIISVGTASHEGGDESERFLADRRARKLQAEVRSVTKDNPSLQFFTLNLGRFSDFPVNGSSSSDERPVVVIGIDGDRLCERNDAMITDALQRAFPINTHDQRFDYKKYTDFVLSSVRLECSSG